MRSGGLREHLKSGTIKIMLRQIPSIKLSFRNRWPRTHVNYHQLTDTTSTAHTYGLMQGWGDLRPTDKEKKPKLGSWLVQVVSR